MLFYDEDLKLSRTMIFSNVRTMQDRVLPSVTRMATGRQTQTSIPKLPTMRSEFDRPLEDDLFSLQNLER